MESKLLSGMIPVSLESREDVIQAKFNLLAAMKRNIVFKDDICKLIYNVLVSYFRQTQGFPDTDMFGAILQDNDIEQDVIAKSMMKFDILSRETIPPDKYTFYLNRLSDNNSKEDFENTLILALDTLKEKDDIQEGTTALSKAKQLLIPKLFESTMLAEDAPHGDITDEKDEILAEYEQAEKIGGQVNGLYTGIKKIDEAVDAMIKGQLIIVAGASSEGKSWIGANIAWHITTQQKKNVCLITAETLRPQYRRRIMVRHSNLPKFGHPLEFEKVKNGTLSEEEKEVYQMVVEDFTNGQYGHLDISQISLGTSLTDVRIYLESLNLLWPIDIVILDYLSLFQPSSRRGSQREESVELMKEAKQIAISFDGGAGIPILTLHQISTQAREKAKWAKGKCYTLGSLADTSEAAKSGDIVWALFRGDDMIDEHELGVQILKTRDSYSEDRMFKLFEDFSHAYIGDLEE